MLQWYNHFSNKTLVSVHDRATGTRLTLLMKLENWIKYRENTVFVLIQTTGTIVLWILREKIQMRWALQPGLLPWNIFWTRQAENNGIAGLRRKRSKFEKDNVPGTFRVKKNGEDELEGCYIDKVLQKSTQRSSRILAEYKVGQSRVKRHKARQREAVIKNNCQSSLGWLSSFNQPEWNECLGNLKKVMSLQKGWSSLKYTPNSP